ncbi:MAG: ABC transporter permease [Gemmataceae bacterium]|jgi:ABC-type transport system involved in multi-copper enzyme maturation permease subunit|nr:ABC transporter permease [Gemmataceae bacterium]
MNSISESPTETSENTQERSVFSAWLFLVGFAFRRHLRVRGLVGLSLALLVICTAIVALFSFTSGWDRYEARLKRAPTQRIAFFAGSLSLVAAEDSEYIQRIRKETKPLAVFSKWVIFMLTLGFILPVWAMSFATSSIGSERESRSLVWLTSRPIPRYAVYLAKFLGTLPWCLGLTIGGFGILCLAGGENGRIAFTLFWEALLLGSVAFAALFHLFGAIFPRPAIVALLYSFFFETMLSELPIPGTLKRLSINYYVRCLLYDSAEPYDIPTETASLFAPVSTAFAYTALIGGSLALVFLGAWLFAKLEPKEDI